MKPSITLLHHLPNRVRFKLSKPIRNIEEVKTYMMKTQNITLFRYNPTINTLLIRFHSNKNNYKKIKLHLIIAISKDNYLEPIKFFEKTTTQEMTPLVLESALFISLAKINKYIIQEPNIQLKLEQIAALLTVGATSIHGISELKRKGVFDPEVVSVFYLIHAIFNKNYLTSSVVTWFSTFGRHLLSLLHFSRDGKEYRVFKEITTNTTKPLYHVVLSQSKNVTNLDDLIYNLFNKDARKAQPLGTYISLGNKENEIT